MENPDIGPDRLVAYLSRDTDLIMELQRSSGLLLHPTSLPGPGGVGSLGRPARRFVDRLEEAGQRWWQILPLHPPGHGGSPYAATSAFAGNPTLLDMRRLAADGWLSDNHVSEFEAECEKFSPRRFAIDEVTHLKTDLLDRAASRWLDDDGRDDPDFRAFCADHNELWLDDFALYTALKRRFDGASWRDWPTELVRRDRQALERARRRLDDEIAAVKFVQWQWFDQWADLVDYAHDRGVRLMGDLPIFVAMDSADVWANRQVFDLDDQGRPDAVAGVPPDYFSETGQRWGNPLYDWDQLADDDYRWFVDRVEHTLRTVDLVRVDHFRGFQAFWRIPADEETAVNGRWVEGPNDAIFEAIRDRLGEVPFVAEDLGTITDEVHRLRDRQGLPGMKVMQFAFDGDPDHPFKPHTYPEHTVAYTGTHDNDTTRGWFDSLEEDHKHRVRTYLSASDDVVVQAMIEQLWSSKAAMAIIPLQDLFELGSDHRMNTPGRARGNWEWRMTSEELNDRARFEHLRKLTDRADRTTH